MAFLGCFILTVKMTFIGTACMENQMFVSKNVEFHVEQEENDEVCPFHQINQPRNSFMTQIMTCIIQFLLPFAPWFVAFYHHHPLLPIV